ncbi:hypothetical protein C8Q77DRAFT_1063255 [Trametes polyzona]|nr:hypothetical protein C8Q77DRAFT_1063255 [Trametes polyzona]
MSLADVQPTNSPRFPSPSPAPSASILSSPRAKGKQVRSADYEDWENLKELFARAAERYDADDIPEALPLLRAVIRECHRFLMDHPDPSVVYADPPSHRSSRSPDAITPTEERLNRDWGMDSDSASASASTSPNWSHRRRSPAELPTAFHAIFGITLFLLGNLVAQDPSIVLPGEPDAPSTYWLAALDVFETGENLPSRTGGSNLDTAEDWRMAIVWGRTLVCLADEKVTYNMKRAKEQATATNGSGGALVGSDYCYYPSGSSFSMSEPQWPPSSPFHAIAQFRPPVTRRMSLYSASAHDIMVLAMDQFSRGIFHMPHPQYSASHNPSFIHTPGASGAPAHSSGYFASALAPASHYASPASTTDSSGSPSSGLTFSRPKELFTIASEVLGVAERLSSGTQRHYWASWADSVFNQMKNEADMDAWRGPILSARGRCWLVMGSAPVEDMEAALEAGQTEVLHSAEAEDAREGLAMAISFFERAKGQRAITLARDAAEGASGAGAVDDVSPLLVEALLVLANLTVDENKREELYTRAQAEAGEDLRLDLDMADGASANGSARSGDEPMDVS